MKQFMNLQPKHWQAIYAHYLHCVDDPEAAQKFIELTTQDLVERGFSPDQAALIAPAILKTFTHSELHDSFIENDPDAEENEAKLSLQDIKLLKEKLLHESSPEARRLLVAFLVYARANPHPSFWIKYDKKVVFFLASIQKLKVSEQNDLTIRLHNLYNLDMQVVGSNQPIPCFKILWQAEQEPAADTPDNPFVLLGPLNPATITSFVKQIPYEEEQ